MFPELVSSPFSRADLYALYYIPLYYIPHGASPSSCGNHVVVCHRQGPSSTLPSIGPFWTGFSSLLLCHCRWMLVLVVLLVFITSAGAAGVEQEVRPPLLLTVAADYPYVYVPLSHPRLIILSLALLLYPSLPLLSSPMLIVHPKRHSKHSEVIHLRSSQMARHPKLPSPHSVFSCRLAGRGLGGSVGLEKSTSTRTAVTLRRAEEGRRLQERGA